MKRILVALDGSPRAPKVLEAAVRLAELTGAKLIVYRAVSLSPDIPRLALVDANAGLEELLLANARKELEALAEHVDPKQLESITAGLAIPWDGICRIGRERDADLIVIGSHGYGGLDRLLGTVAAKVVNHADRNVLVVRTSL